MNPRQLQNRRALWPGQPNSLPLTRKPTPFWLLLPRRSKASGFSRRLPFGLQKPERNAGIDTLRITQSRRGT
jgi:hypothetical protein